MNLPEITAANVYCCAERFGQTVPTRWLGLYISGLKRMIVYRADGRLLFEDDATTEPHLFLRFPGMRCRFEFGRERENFVIGFQLDELTFDDATCGALLDGVPIPLRIPLSPPETESMRRRFRTLTAAFRSGLPGGILASRLEAAGILGRFLRRDGGEISPQTAAEKFRRLIDEDCHWQKSLAELASVTGMSSDHLRTLFLAEYRITPGEYRRRKRVDRIMELIAQSDLTLKEIADEVGMKNVTHLYALMAGYFKETPAKLVRIHRAVRE